MSNIDRVRRLLVWVYKTEADIPEDIKSWLLRGLQAYLDAAEYQSLDHCLGLAQPGREHHQQIERRRRRDLAIQRAAGQLAANESTNAQARAVARELQKSARSRSALPPRELRMALRYDPSPPTSERHLFRIISRGK